MRRSRTLVLLLVVAGCLAARGRVARADPTTILAGRIDRVVAVGQGLAVLRAGEVLLLDGAGHTVGRCGGQGALAGRAPRTDRTTIPAERLLRESGFREDDDSPEAEALLDDEGIDARRRRRPIDAAAGMPRALSLAADGDAVWIGTTDGLWRMAPRTGSCARVGLGGHALERVAAARGIVVAVADVTVWRSADAGASFALATVLTSRARAVALAGEVAFVATDDAVVAVTAARYARPVLEQPADAIVTCGAHAIALGEDGVYRLDADGRVERLGDRPAARALGCVSPAGPSLWAVGVGAWSTGDGHTWREEPPFLGRSIADVAFAGGRAWLALQDGLDDGLVASPALDGGDAEDRPALQPRPSRARPSRPSPPSWAWLLPRVSVSFDGFTESRARAGWRLWLVLTVTLDRRRFGRAPEGPGETSEVLQ